MSAILMPKATALWLVDNTALTFQQIADFCNLHPLEVEQIADGDLKIQPVDPVAGGQLVWEHIHACEKDGAKKLEIANSVANSMPSRKKGSRYIPIAKRQDKPNAIHWILKHYPDVNDSQICRLLGTTSATITAIRNRTHKDMEKIVAKSPVKLNLCTEADLQKEIDLAHKKED